MLTHKECVHYFSCEKGANTPKLQMCFFPFIFSNPPWEPITVSAQKPERLRVFSLWVLPTSDGASACFGQQGAVF